MEGHGQGVVRTVLGVNVEVNEPCAPLCWALVVPVVGVVEDRARRDRDNLGFGRDAFAERLLPIQQAVSIDAVADFPVLCGPVLHPDTGLGHW